MHKKHWTIYRSVISKFWGFHGTKRMINSSFVFNTCWIQWMQMKSPSGNCCGFQLLYLTHFGLFERQSYHWKWYFKKIHVRLEVGMREGVSQMRWSFEDGLKGPSWLVVRLLLIDGIDYGLRMERYRLLYPVMRQGEVSHMFIYQSKTRRWGCVNDVSDCTNKDETSYSTNHPKTWVIINPIASMIDEASDTVF